MPQKSFAKFAKKLCKIFYSFSGRPALITVAGVETLHIQLL